MFREIEEGTS